MALSSLRGVRRALRRRRTAALLVSVAALSVTAALVVDPIITWRAEQRLKDRFGDVRSVEIDRAPLSWLTGEPVSARVELGNVRAELGALGMGGRVDELELTAESLRTGKLQLEQLRARRAGLRTTITAIVPAQELAIVGRTVAMAPDAENDTLILRPEGIAFIPSLRVTASGGGIVATIDGGPLDGRTMPLGGQRADAARVEQLVASTDGEQVRLTTTLVREEA